MKEYPVEISKKIEQLQKDLNALVKQEEKQLIKEYYPSLKKQYEGKYFKSRNSYGSGKNWWVYIKIIEIKPQDVYDTRGSGITSYYRGWSFQTTSSKEVTIDQSVHSYVHSLGKEITKKEFTEAWSKVLKNLPDL